MESQKKISTSDIVDQKDQLEDENGEISLDNLCINDLNIKVQSYNKLFVENKINASNAFKIDIISCVQQIVKKTNEENFLDISETFDAISRVYACRVDNLWTTGSELLKIILEEKKNLNKEHVKESEIIVDSNRKLMLTTAENLCNDYSEELQKFQYLSCLLDNDIVDYVKPSRILINKFSNKTYWPEYNFSKDMCLNKNKLIKYEIEDICDAVKNSNICPNYHQFIAECDNSKSDDDFDDLDNINTNFHLNQETSIANELNNLSDDCSKKNEPLYIDTIKKNSKGIFHQDSSCNYKKKSLNKQNNLDSISQILPIVDTNYSDYSFFDPKNLYYFKCSNHWREKFKLMTMTSQQKAMKTMSHVISQNDDFPTYCETNTFIDKSTKSGNVDFNLNIKKILKKLRYETGENQCCYESWKSSDNLTELPCLNDLKISPIRKLKMCKYINMVPKWYKNELKELIQIKQNSMTSFPEQYILSGQFLDSEFSIKTVGNIDNIMNTDNNYADDSYKNNTDLSSDSMNEIQNDTHEESEFSTPEYIDMVKLKKCILNIIKPDGNQVLSITFKDLLIRLSKSLPEEMNKNISVAVIYVAILHLTNEYNLHLEENSDEIIISQC